MKPSGKLVMWVTEGMFHHHLEVVATGNPQHPYGYIVGRKKLYEYSSRRDG